MSDVEFTGQAIDLMAAWDRVLRAVEDFDGALISHLAAAQHIGDGQIGAASPGEES